MDHLAMSAVGAAAGSPVPAWLPPLIVPVIAGMGVLLVAAYTSHKTGQRELAGRRAASDAEALRALFQAVMTFRSLARQAGNESDDGPERAAFEDSAAELRVCLVSIRMVAVRTQTEVWERAAEAYFANEPATTRCREQVEWRALLDCLGEAARELYRGDA